MSTGDSKDVRNGTASLLPSSLPQNPAPTGEFGQQYVTSKQDLTDSIINTFYQVLPSNYVAEITGPYYTLQFQAIAEALADIQILAQQVHLDTQIDFTRPEYLWQTFGTLIFPDLDASGLPQIEGDYSYRQFLKTMLSLLVKGSTLEAQKEGLEALADNVTITVREKSTAGARGYANQSTFEVDVQGCATWVGSNGDVVTGSLGTGFASDPITHASNASIVLRALKPGHVFYEYRNVLTEVFGSLFSDTWSADFQVFKYQDFRHFWGGRKQVTGTAGETLTDRTLFSDPTRTFESIRAGSVLTLLSGQNQSSFAGGVDAFYDGRHVVSEVLQFPFATDATARAYTTSPSNLSGVATVTAGVVEDASQDWSQAVEGEILTFSEGLNMGTYRIHRLLGPGGGILGRDVLGTGITQMTVSPSLLRLETRMPVAATGQSYTVTIERKGVKVPQVVENENVSSQL